MKANGTFSDQIATYDFKTEVDGFYSIWLDLLGTSTYDNSVTYHVDDQMQISSHLIVKKKEPTWNCLSRNVSDSCWYICIGSTGVNKVTRGKMSTFVISYQCCSFQFFMLVLEGFSRGSEVTNNY